MRVHCFGEAGLPTVVLIHGLATTWKQSFGKIIPLLSVRYHVIAVSLSGHDPADPEDFVSRKSEADQLALHLRQQRAGQSMASSGPPWVLRSRSSWPVRGRYGSTASS